ncbi:MAG: 8-oxo-dGTP diphosphatase [Bacilli bacterium]|nr:8-oxo-dGTP diphosphatase [Bacilli bacterium]
MDKTVLAYIKKEDSYLMLYRNKEENDMNEGFYMGVGGHIEKGETPDMALIREIKEETSLIAKKFTLRGLLHFANDDYKEIIYLYTVEEAEGEIGECNEGDLSYIKIKDILNLPMWEGDKYFLDLLAKDEPYFELELIYKDRDFVSVKRLK